MHKDVVVLTGDYDSRRHRFRRVNEVITPDHLPPGVILHASAADLDSLNRWLLWRGIPHYRVDLDRLKKRLRIADEKGLLETEYALSVSDQYWLCPMEESRSYAELNFFTRPFDQDGFAQAVFRSTNYEPRESALHTPNNTLCGYHRKAWMKVDDVLCLYKGSTGFNQQECINEWLASVLAERLGLYCVPYDVLLYENRLVSVCPNILNPDLDLITASDAIAAMNGGSDTADSFRSAMEAHGIRTAEASLEELYLLDYLMMNTDRHGQNAGILVDANTGRWISMAPIFDTGTGLGCFVKTSMLEGYDRDNRNYRLFSERHLPFDSLPERIRNWSRYDFAVLDDVKDLFCTVLANYRPATGISDERIDALGRLLQRRIDGVKHYQLSHRTPD